MPDLRIPKWQGKVDPSMPLVQPVFPQLWLNPFMALLEGQSECYRNTDGSCPLKGSCCAPVITGPRLVAISIIQHFCTWTWALGKPAVKCSLDFQVTRCCTQYQVKSSQVSILSSITHNYSWIWSIKQRQVRGGNCSSARSRALAPKHVFQLYP